MVRAQGRCESIGKNIGSEAIKKKSQVPHQAEFLVLVLFGTSSELLIHT